MVRFFIACVDFAAPQDPPLVIWDPTDAGPA